MARARKKARRGSFSFRVVNTRHVTKPSGKEIVLERDLWDDFGIRCSFRVLVTVSGKHQLIGTWKIVDTQASGGRTTTLPRTFSRLPTKFVSLGQQLAVYEHLAELDSRQAQAVLEGLNDVVFRPRSNLEDVDGFETALVRFAEASEALTHGGRVLADAGLLKKATTQAEPTNPLVISVIAELTGFPAPHSVTLRFTKAPQELALRRLMVAVGPNGCGKTQLLGALARSFSGLTSRNIKTVPRQPFSNIIAISYGAFDHFTHPRLHGAETSYVYCGLRVPPPPTQTTKIVLDLEGAIERVVHDIGRLKGNPRRRVWQQALKFVALEALASEGARGPKATRHHFDTLSAGQKIVAMTITNMVVNLRPQTLILHDEPETHLHPAMLSSLLRAVHFLLEEFDSYALIATHSLIPAQEVPSENVVIMDRDEDGSVRTNPPADQSFASTLDKISRIVFRRSPEEDNYRRTLIELHKTHSPDQIETILGGDLGLGARLLLASLKP